MTFITQYLVLELSKKCVKFLIITSQTNFEIQVRIKQQISLIKKQFWKFVIKVGKSLHLQLDNSIAKHIFNENVFKLTAFQSNNSILFFKRATKLQRKFY